MLALRSVSRTPSGLLSHARLLSTPAKHDYDLAIIGGGPGGYVAAIKVRARALDCNVTVPSLALTCTLRHQAAQLGQRRLGG